MSFVDGTTIITILFVSVILLLRYMIAVIKNGVSGLLITTDPSTIWDRIDLVSNRLSKTPLATGGPKLSSEPMVKVIKNTDDTVEKKVAPTNNDEVIDMMIDQVRKDMSKTRDHPSTFRGTIATESVHQSIELRDKKTVRPMDYEPAPFTDSSDAQLFPLDY